MDTISRGSSKEYTPFTQDKYPGHLSLFLQKILWIWTCFLEKAEVVLITHKSGLCNKNFA
jgi:hypothetical protein